MKKRFIDSFGVVIIRIAVRYLEKVALCGKQ